MGVRIPSRKGIYVFRHLRDGANSPQMSVNGSVTPVHFEFAPTTGAEWQVERLLFGIDDVGLTDMGLFGGLSLLPNGVEIKVKSAGEEAVVGVIRNNIDIAMIFQVTVVGQSGVLDSADGMCGALEFLEPIQLLGDQGDFIRMSVRDNLTGINILRSMVVARRIS